MMASEKVETSGKPDIFAGADALAVQTVFRLHSGCQCSAVVAGLVTATDPARSELCHCCCLTSDHKPTYIDSDF